VVLPVINTYVSFEGFEPVLVTPEGGDAREKSIIHKGALIEYYQAIGKKYLAPAMHALKIGATLALKYGLSLSPMAASESMYPIIDSMAYSGGTGSPAQVLATHPGVMCNTQGRLPKRDASETMLAWIAAQPAIVNVGLTATTRFYVYPGTLVNASGHMVLTPAGFAMSFFRSWRATMCVELTFYSCSLTRGRVKICKFQDGALLGVNTANGTGWTETVDILGTTVVTFKFPYAGMEYATTSGYGGSVGPSFLYIVEDSFLDGAGAALTIKPVVKIWAEDFEGFQQNLIPPVDGGGGSVIPEGGTFDGELIESLATLVKQRDFNAIMAPSINASWMTIPSSGIYNTVGSMGPAGAEIVLREVGWTNCAWAKLAYLGWTGSQTFVFRPVVMSAGFKPIHVSRTVATIGVNLSDAYTLGFNADQSIYGPTAGVMPEGVAEVRVTDRNLQAFHVGPTKPSLSWVQYEDAIRLHTTYFLEGDEVYVFHGGGDDFELGYFLGLPFLNA